MLQPEDFTGQVQPDFRPLRYRCTFCNQLFDTFEPCVNHVKDEHLNLVVRIYVRPTYAEK